jgi:SPP1 family predicted phage head-tail adaptor
MRAGGLKARVQLQAQSVSQDAVGQPVNTWATVASVWANIRHQRGIEQVKADMQVSKVRASIRIRYRTDVTADMRVVHNTGTYQILAVSPDLESKDHLDLVCEKYE